MNALAKDEVGKFFKANFVASHQKIGNFTIDGSQKQGGNVASYFCTADGRVLHVVAGPVSADTLLKEARWVVETWKAAQLVTHEADQPLRNFMHNAHAARLRNEHKLDLHKPGNAMPGGGLPSGTHANTVPIYDQPRFGKLDRAGRVHLLLAASPLIPIERLYAVVFEKVLDERVSILPVDKK